MALTSRRIHIYYTIPAPISAAAGKPTAPTTYFDADVVMILGVLLAALVCALCLNAIFRCAFSLFGRSSTTSVFPSTAIRRRAIFKLPFLIYNSSLKIPGSDSECAICLGRFEPGDRVRLLPKCNHCFHLRCIDRWLLNRPNCPTCRQCLFDTTPKATPCVEPEEAGHAVIEPLDHEGLELGYLL